MKAATTRVPQKIKTKCEKPKRFTEEEVKKILLQIMKDIAIVDPYPRTMKLIFSKPKLNELKNKFKIT